MFKNQSQGATRALCKYLIGILVSVNARRQLGRHAVVHGNLAQSIEGLLYVVLVKPLSLSIGSEYVQFMDGPLSYRLSLTSDDFTQMQKDFFQFMIKVHGNALFRVKSWTPSGQSVFNNFAGHQILSSLFPRRALAFALVYDFLSTSRSPEHFLNTQFALVFALRRLVPRVPHSYIYFVQYVYAWVTRAIYVGETIPKLQAKEERYISEKCSRAGHTEEDTYERHTATSRISELD